LRLGTLAAGSSSATDKLIADLENHLGDTLTPYLSVRLSYKHTGFEIDGLTTAIHTETTASIPRFNHHSPWVPTTPKVVKGPVNNPLITLIEMHLPTDEAREAIHKLADERIQIPLARRLNGSGGQYGEYLLKINTS